MIESICLMDARDEGREEGRKEERKNTEVAIKRAEKRADDVEALVTKYRAKYGEL